MAEVVELQKLKVGEALNVFLSDTVDLVVGLLFSGVITSDLTWLRTSGALNKQFSRAWQLASYHSCQANLAIKKMFNQIPSFFLYLSVLEVGDI